MTGLPGRAERLGALARGSFDVLVIGGGITGAAVARDAASRGLSVAIVERGDWASGTSWRSTKLVHGGLRYLRQARIGLVFESLAERSALLAAAPHLVRPLEFLFAVTPRRWVTPSALSAGLTLYDLLALGRGAPRHRRLAAADVLACEPLCAGAAFTGGAIYGDASCDDARLTLENVLDAAALGATAVSGIECAGFLLDGSGRTRGIAARDVESGRELEVTAGVTVDATGPWSDELERRGEPQARPRLRLSRGAHITVPAGRLPVRRAVAVPVESGRLFFAIPSGPVTLLGTTETDDPGPADAAAPTREDVAYILARAAEAFPAAGLSPTDALAAFAGLRPLRVEPGRGVSETSREESIEVGRGRVLVTGGKLTTHRRIGKRAVDASIALLHDLGSEARVGPSRTAGRSFPGAPPRSPASDAGAAARDLGSFVADLVRDAREYGATPELAAHLGGRYGSRAKTVLEIVRADPSAAAPLVEGLPDCEAEVRFAARFEDARSASDVLIRRTHLFWQTRGQAMAAVARVHEILARELGGNPRRDVLSSEDYVREVARSRAAL